jgi:hypothetical protein
MAPHSNAKLLKKSEHAKTRLLDGFLHAHIREAPSICLRKGWN